MLIARASRRFESIQVGEGRLSLRPWLDHDDFFVRKMEASGLNFKIDVSLDELIILAMRFTFVPLNLRFKCLFGDYSDVLLHMLNTCVHKCIQHSRKPQIKWGASSDAGFAELQLDKLRGVEDLSIACEELTEEAQAEIARAMTRHLTSLALHVQSHVHLSPTCLAGASGLRKLTIVMAMVCHPPKKTDEETDDDLVGIGYSAASSARHC